MTVEFPAIKRNLVATEAIDTIKQMIVRGDIRAGERLPAERDLAIQLGLSRPTLREAIRALIALNILESRHGEGTFVSSLEPELLAEPIDFVLRVNEHALTFLYEARRVLDAGLAELAAQRITEAELLELEELMRRARREVQDVDAFIEHDVEFHGRIRNAARSPLLSSVIASVNMLSYESRKRVGTSEVVRAQAIDDHEAVVRALRTRDPEAARLAMTSHLNNVLAIFAADAVAAGGQVA